MKRSLVWSLLSQWGPSINRNKWLGAARRAGNVLPRHGVRPAGIVYRRETIDSHGTCKLLFNFNICSMLYSYSMCCRTWTISDTECLLFI